MRTILIIISLAILVSIMYSCDYWSRISIKNDSKESIYSYIGLGGNGGTLHPDTLLPKSDLNYEIKPNTVYDMDWLGMKDVSELFDRSDTLCVFIVSRDTVNKYGWEDVKQNYRILRRYDVSIHDLRSLKEILVYPPTPEMSHIKMWPPYGK